MTRMMFHLRPAVSAVLALSLATPAFAQSNPEFAPAGKDWPRVAGNLASWGYTGLTQINKSNLKQLGPAWVTHVSAEPVTQPVPGPGNNLTAQQTVPIVVDGIMYLDTPGGGVIALHGATGAVKWKWQPSVAGNGFAGVNQHRGVSVGEGKVYTTAAGNRVIALDKETGALVWAVVPTDKNGTPIAGVSKVATIYHDGLVYMGNNDTGRGAAFALRASDGALQWAFYGAYPAGTSFTDVNGTTFDAGATWTTLNTPNDTPNDCYLNGGATPWMHPTIDTELGLGYWTFGNVRSCNGSQNGAARPGDNLFSNSIVAIDLKTGAYKWHFQSVRHDIFDMDNVLPPTLADVTIGGQVRKVAFYGSKSNHQFVLDRTNGKPALPIEYRAVPGDVRNAPALTQPFPVSGGYMPYCVEYQNLGSDIPGAQNRIVPNWNGYQAEPDPARPGQLRLVLKTPNYLSAEDPFLVGPPRQGCMYDGAYDGFVFMSMTSQNGGNDMTNASISPRLNLRYFGVSFSPVGHPLQQGGNGLRQIGGYQSGGLVAIDNSTNKVAWYKRLELDLSRQHNPLVTATDLLFHTQIDGLLVGRDAATGDELWRFQTGAPGQTGTISYEIDGEQYIATTSMGGGQPYSQGFNGDMVWAFKIGGKAKYTTGPRANPVVVSGSSEAPSPPPIVNKRRPVDNTAAGDVPANTVYLARSNGTAMATKDSTNTSAMVPSRLTVPIGTTVTFTNPGDAAFGVPGSGNQLEHCATQFFEGRFNFRLRPGQSAQHVFDKEGEYHYNDCTDPRPAGKVIVTLAPTPAPLQVVPPVLNLRAPSGAFTDVAGLVTTVMTVPAGWKLDVGPVGDPSIGPVTVLAPLTTQTFNAVTAALSADGRTLIATFDKAALDNNIPTGDAVPLVVSANFVDAGGVQRKLAGTANVRVLK
jgi:quinohemoprotein ethanol dehydrogenase